MSEQAELKYMKPDYASSPFLVLWELTRACALACQHCRARALRKRDPAELSETEVGMVLDQLEEFGRPLLVLTGGDPFERPDLLDIVRQARSRDFKVAITPSATPRITENAIQALAEAGVSRLAISLDGADAASHDAFRRVSGSYDHTVRILSWARNAGIPIQINTSICKHNHDLFDKIHEQVLEMQAILWSIFFIVPTGRANRDMQISAKQAEEIMLKMAGLAVTGELDIKATAAPHFRRVLLDTISPDKNIESPLQKDLGTIHPHMRLGALRSYQSVNDGKGVIFISHTGDIYPSGFLPLAAGNLRETPMAELYRNSPLFQQLRDPSLLTGKCGECRFKDLCGGSRARAYAETGDYLAEDSLCVYQEEKVQVLT